MPVFAAAPPLRSCRLADKYGEVLKVLTVHCPPSRWRRRIHDGSYVRDDADQRLTRPLTQILIKITRKQESHDRPQRSGPTLSAQLNNYRIQHNVLPCGGNQ